MNGDQLSFKRATTVSLIGLALQIVLAGVLFTYALLAGDSAALTGALAIGLGAFIWIALAVVFHQHTLERIEALEFDAYLSSSAAQASVFEDARSDEQPHKRRLEALHRYFLPTVSLIIAFAYTGLGLFRFFKTRSFLGVDSDYVAPTQAGWAIAIGVFIVILGFVFARFVAGMAKQKVWMLLHGGSGGAVGSALIGAALAITHFIKVAANAESPLRFLAPLLGLFMVFLGIEIALNFLLNLYRPRHANEYQRPAFDSRILAFVAAPDRLAESIGEAINYQFGFDVSSSWAYRLIARKAPLYLVLAILVVWGLSVFHVIRPEERGLMILNGKLAREVNPGLVVTWPWPWAKIDRFPAESVNELHIGSSRPVGGDPILWTKEHSKDERFFLVQPASLTDQSPILSQAKSDLNLVAAEVPVTYVVNDLRKYKLLAQDGRSEDIDSIRHDLLESVASQVVMQYLSTLSVDEMLGAHRQQATKELLNQIQARYDQALDAGVKILSVGIVGAHPEHEVAQAFEQVVAADQKKLTLVEQAEIDAIRSLASIMGDVQRAQRIVSELDALDLLTQKEGQSSPAVIEQEQKVIDLIMGAGGEAATLIAEAKADRWRQHMQAASRAASVEGLIASYRAAPAPFRVERYIKALRAAAAQARIYISPFDNLKVSLNKEEQVPVVSGFDLGKQSDEEKK